MVFSNVPSRIKVRGASLKGFFPTTFLFEVRSSKAVRGDTSNLAQRYEVVMQQSHSHNIAESLRGTVGG